MVASPTPTIQMPNSVLSGLSSLALQANKYISSTSNFSNNNGMENMSPDQGLLFFIIFILLIYFTMYLGAFVFNASIVKIFPSVKKVNTLDFFGLYIVLHLLFC
jgi:hypothetical protein